MMQATTLRELGAVLEGTDFHFYDAGAYAAVFVDLKKRRARKIFFDRGVDNETFVQSVFDDEIEAYNRAKSHGEANQLTPEFFGQAPNCNIVDKSGNLLNDRFMGQLVYEMDYIEGQAIKLRDCPLQSKIEKIFIDAHINFIKDASVFNWTGKPVVIDFGTFEPHPAADPPLPDKHGLWSPVAIKSNPIDG